MPREPVSESDKPKNEFEQLARDKQLSLVREVSAFLVDNKKWWLLPIVLALGLVGILAVLGATGAAPFIYTLY